MAEKEKNEDNAPSHVAESGGIHGFHGTGLGSEGMGEEGEGLPKRERYGWGVAREEYPTNPQERLEWKVDRLDEKIDKKIDEQGRRIDRLDEKIDKKIDEQGRRIDRLDEKVDRLDEKIYEVKEGLSAVTESIKSLRWLLTVFFLPLIGSLVVAVFVLAFNTLS